MPRNQAVGVRVNESELRLLEVASAANDLAVATMVRQAALRAARAVVDRVVEVRPDEQRQVDAD